MADNVVFMYVLSLRCHKHEVQSMQTDKHITAVRRILNIVVLTYRNADHLVQWLS